MTQKITIVEYKLILHKYIYINVSEILARGTQIKAQ